MEGDCNVYAHSSLWMRPTGEWSINAKMVYTATTVISALVGAFAVTYSYQISSIYLFSIGPKLFGCPPQLFWE